MQFAKTRQFPDCTRLSRPSSDRIYWVNKSVYGPRVCVTKWLDTGEIVVRAVKGDGRTKQFQVFEELKLSDDKGMDFDVLASHLADKFFGGVR